MSTRKWIYNAVKATEGQAAFSADRIYSTGGVEGDEGPGDSPTRPFIVIRAATNQVGLGHVKQQRFQVFLHQDPGSMVDIDDLCKALEEQVPAMAPDSSGEWSPHKIMEALWEDTSGDGYDDHYQTATRFVTFLLTYNPS